MFGDQVAAAAAEGSGGWPKAGRAQVDPKRLDHDPPMTQRHRAKATTHTTLK